jgi:hypothetical protein
LFLNIIFFSGKKNKLGGKNSGTEWQLLLESIATQYEMIMSGIIAVSVSLI